MPNEALAASVLRERHVGYAVMDHAQAFAGRCRRRARADPRPVAESDDNARGALAQLAGDAQYHVVGFGQHGVHGQNDGLGDFVEQVDEPLAALAAEEAVLVLDIEQISRVARR